MSHLRDRMPLLPILLVATVSAVTALAAAQPNPPPARIVVDPNTRVTTAGTESLSVEPHLAVHPGNPQILVVAAMEFAPNSPSGAIVAHVSENGGRTWKRSPLPDGANGADPWLTFDRAGTLYLVQIGGREPSADPLWRSQDNGYTWEPPVALPRGNAGPYDYPKILIDESGSSSRVVILATQTDIPIDRARKVSSVVLLTSKDGLELTRHTLAPNDVTHQNGVPALLSTGQIVIPFHELTHQRSLVKSPRLWTVTTGSDDINFSRPSLVTEQFTADSPFLVAGRGKFRDRVYAGWMGLAGQYHHYVARSTDGGATWSAPVRASDSNESKRLPTHHPMLAVTGAGVLGLSWYDGRDDASGQCFKLYFTASLDGGETFLPNVPVSDAASCPSTPANQKPLAFNSSMTVVRRFKEGGDYHGLVALPDGSFHAMWSDSRDGSYQLWTTRIRLTTP